MNSKSLAKVGRTAVLRSLAAAKLQTFARQNYFNDYIKNLLL